MMLSFADELLSCYPHVHLLVQLDVLIFLKSYPNPKPSSELKKPCGDEVNNQVQLHKEVDTWTAMTWVT